MKHIVWRVRFSNWYGQINGIQYQIAYALLRPGDIILTTDKAKLTSYLIKGEWTHAALFVGKFLSNQNYYEVAEMTHKGFTKSMLFDLCKECDRFAILRPRTWDKDYIREVVLKNLKALEECEYDLKFDFDIKALYCSELIYQCDSWEKCRVDLSDFAGLGRQYVSPLAYWESPDVEIIYDSRSR
jgi:hypothetical protein